VSKFKVQRDPRGHSLRIYSDLYESHAYAALSPYDVVAYLALLRVLKGSNNGDLSLPLSRAKKCGIHHPRTLARSLRALCAVGLVAITRKGGCTRGGQRLATLYRMTDRECYEIPSKFLEAMPATNEWKRITSVQQALELIDAAENRAGADAQKLKSPGHAVTDTGSRSATVRTKTGAPCEPWDEALGHRVNMAEKSKSIEAMRAAGGFSQDAESGLHGAPRSTPIYVAIPTSQKGFTDGLESYRRLTERPCGMFTQLLATVPTSGHACRAAG
jgi:hypothetical protein